MTVDRRHFAFLNPGLEPLPSEFEPQLQSLDARLHEAIAGGSQPGGLSERVFQASVESLPNRNRLRLVGAERESGFAARRIKIQKPAIFAGGGAGWGGRQVWARLAMAAALALVVGTGMWLIQHTPGQAGSGGGSRVALDNAPVVTGASVALALESMPQGHTAELESRVSHLLETDGMNSFDELTSELSNMVAALEVEM